MRVLLSIVIGYIQLVIHVFSHTTFNNTFVSLACPFPPLVWWGANFEELRIHPLIPSRRRRGA